MSCSCRFFSPLDHYYSTDPLQNGSHQTKESKFHKISRALGLSSSNADVQVTEIASSAPRVQDSKSYERLLYGGKQMESSKGTSPPLESCTTSDGLLLLSHPLMYVGNHLPPADRNQA
ncbi:RING-H2 finger protein [Musa troglodytarum]|uniref:RING-H2 finger protein n=1 Tax=Musa troglodytarum TaxID=320322 RepID=A0A9E7I331_9LILI|nr:RING-H2 finger protein [Musa troglodytarum]